MKQKVVIIVDFVDNFSRKEIFLLPFGIRNSTYRNIIITPAK
jgi:hypothetical protein